MDEIQWFQRAVLLCKLFEKYPDLRTCSNDVIEKRLVPLQILASHEILLVGEEHWGWRMPDGLYFEHGGVHGPEGVRLLKSYNGRVRFALEEVLAACRQGVEMGCTLVDPEFLP